MKPDDGRRRGGPEEEPVMIGSQLHQVEGDLRAALHADAGSIQPGERLGAILSAAHAAPTGGSTIRQRWLVLAAAAAVALVAGGTLWLSGRPTALAPAPAGSTTSRVSTGAATSPTPSTAAGTDQSALPPPGSETPASTDRPSSYLDGVPIYWIGETGGAPRLFREFRTVPDEGGPILSALYAMTREKPLDPDYATPWRPASRITAQLDGSHLTVNLDGDAVSATNVGSEVADRAVQQLVYTATAAASIAKTPVDTVTILVDGQAAELWGAVSVGTPVGRAPVAEVQSHVWITSPTQDQRVAAGPLQVKAFGTSFEATFHWQVSSAADDSMVSAGVVQGGSMGSFEEFEFAIDALPAGSYVLSLSTDDPSGGAEGGGAQTDTKAFTIP